MYIKIWKATLDPSISNSIASTVFTSTAFFYYADFHEIRKFFRAYSTLILPVLAILGYYIWHVDDAAHLFASLWGFLRMTWYLILQWLRDMVSSLRAKSVAYLRA